MNSELLFAICQFESCSKEKYHYMVDSWWPKKPKGLCACLHDSQSLWIHVCKIFCLEREPFGQSHNGKASVDLNFFEKPR